jgi:putative tricarboxylic transport membrane protein
MGFMSFGAASLMPLVLAFIMGPLLEQNLRQSLIMSGGKFSIFVSRPISAVTLALAFLLLLSNIVPFMKRRRKEYEEFKEE